MHKYSHPSLHKSVITCDFCFLTTAHISLKWRSFGIFHHSDVSQNKCWFTPQSEKTNILHLIAFRNNPYATLLNCNINDVWGSAKLLILNAVFHNIQPCTAMFIYTIVKYLHCYVQALATHWLRGGKHCGWFNTKKTSVVALSTTTIFHLPQTAFVAKRPLKSSLQGL